MGRPTHQNVARPRSLQQVRSAATTLKAQNKRRSNQLKFGGQQAYRAARENVKFFAWVTLKTTSGATWVAGNTAYYLGRASCKFGEFLINVSDGLANFTGWLFG